MKVALIVFVCCIGFAPWLINGYKFINCDFEASYRCEIIHGLGVVMPPASLFTVWFGHD